MFGFSLALTGAHRGPETMVVAVAPAVNMITALSWVDIDRTGVVVAAVVANLVRNMWEGNLGRVRSFNVLILRLLFY